MAGGPSKINPPNSHPSNPIYKEATQKKGPVPEEKTPDEPVTGAGGSTETHENNKAAVAVATVGAAALIFNFMR